MTSRRIAAGLAGCFLLLQDGWHRIVVEYPVTHVRHCEVFFFCPTDDLGDAGIDDEPTAHGTGGRAFQICACLRIGPRQIKGCADHITPRGGNNGVRFGMIRFINLRRLS